VAGVLMAIGVGLWLLMRLLHRSARLPPT
jgi:hypothetical protein